MIFIRRWQSCRNVYKALIIILGNEGLSYVWYQIFGAINFNNLLTYMVAFAVFERVTIALILRYPVQFLTKYIQVLLYLSIIAHAFGAFCWAGPSDAGLILYDNATLVIFYLQMLGFIGYGASRGGKRGRAISVPTRMVGVHGFHGSQRNPPID